MSMQKGALKYHEIHKQAGSPNQNSFDSSSRGSRPLQLPLSCMGSDRTSNLDLYIAQAGTLPSHNSVRGPPDPFTLSESIPDDVTAIPPILFVPRAPPALPQHILDLPLKIVLRRYTRLAKLIDDYQRWHTRSVFGFWTDEDLARAASGEAPEYTKALNEDRPSIPPYILNTRFDNVLVSAPLLSHLIERYHNDRGYRYFAFHHADPRESLPNCYLDEENEDDELDEPTPPSAQITECLRNLKQDAFDWRPYTRSRELLLGWLDDVSGNAGVLAMS
ncbi:hypothetical protein F5Y01DRAFT_326769 [Xylaria sp. FL0043]|nr:hypothetical protein F5Y01DRAFT_326769 [Xylaria sp. FL0043]